MEDEEGYTTLNLRPPASVITRGYSNSNKYPAFNAQVNCGTVNSKYRWKLFFYLHQDVTWIYIVPKDSAGGKRLQEMREALCSEGKENNETKCALCPASWQSSGADSCFYISKQKKTWKESQEFCSSRNSTLLVLKDKAKMVSLPQDSQFYWVGLSYKSERNGWYWEDGTALSREAKTWTVLYEHIFCASLYGRIIYASNSCFTKQFWICEKGAIHFA
uniref:C-type lectin domain-containing protein n=1 Tax=Cairina moschata TaxID=8855 RepID=A0A8C3BA33_CAIMO